MNIQHVEDDLKTYTKICKEIINKEKIKHKKLKKTALSNFNSKTLRIKEI